MSAVKLPPAKGAMATPKDDTKKMHDSVSSEIPLIKKDEKAKVGPKPAAKPAADTKAKPAASNAKKAGNNAVAPSKPPS
jgi:hypothetical protein